MRGTTTVTVSDLDDQLIPAGMTPVQIEHQVFKILTDADQFQRDEYDHVLSTEHTYKRVLAYIVLLTKTASCAYSFLLMYSAVNLFVDEPFINQSSSSSIPYIADSIATFLMLTDMKNTYRATHGSVFKLLLKDNWFSSIKSSFTLSRINSLEESSQDKIYKSALFLSAIITMLSKAVSSYVGVNFLFNRLLFNTGIKNNIANTAIQSFSIFVAMVSSVCFWAFQINEKATHVENKRKKLRELDTLPQFEKNNFSTLLKLNATGFIIAIISALVTGISLIRSKEERNIEWYSIAFLILSSVASTVLNLLFTSNPVHRYKVIELTHLKKECDLCLPIDNQNEESSERPVDTKQSCEEHFSKGIAISDSVGTGLSYYTALSEMALLACGKDKMSELPFWLAVGSGLLSLTLGGMVAERSYSMKFLSLPRNRQSSSDDLVRQDRSTVSI